MATATWTSSEDLLAVECYLETMLDELALVTAFEPAAPTEAVSILLPGTRLLPGFVLR